MGDSMEMPVEVQHETAALFSTFVGGGLGGSLVLALAKMYLSHTFEKLNETVKALNHIETKFATMVVQLEKLEKATERVQTHDTKIAVLETMIRKVHG